MLSTRGKIQSVIAVLLFFAVVYGINLQVPLFMELQMIIQWQGVLLVAILYIIALMLRDRMVERFARTANFNRRFLRVFEKCLTGYAFCGSIALASALMPTAVSYSSSGLLFWFANALAASYGVLEYATLLIRDNDEARRQSQNKPKS